MYPRKSNPMAQSKLLLICVAFMYVMIAIGLVFGEAVRQVNQSRLDRVQPDAQNLESMIPNHRNRSP